ncbi:putative I [Danaus plexippus plexippus]|uniref:I n=1 Tax=Danaus plexippus plexippus TaxID=278856 RepID=A0A212EQL7_DANPL|nr:putative I [Danaus plexippus plexippus]
MSRFWNDFQASYHDHVCLIVTEKDVLEISLRGTNWVASFKRWWHDLFLLSHNDPRVRLFYGSSHAVRMDRLKQFRLYRSTIHPLSKFRLKHGEDKPLSNAMLICVEFARICKSFLLFSFSLKPQNQLVMTVEETSNLIKWRQLPDSFARKVRKYYEFNMTRLSITEAVNGLYKNLPQSLRKDISLSSYTHLIIKIPYFAEWPSFLIQNIALLLQEEHYMQGDLVAQASVHSDGLIIIDVGVLGVYSINNEEKGHLIDGDYFCELSLVTDRELRMSSVVALTPSKILFLDKFLFRHLMRDHVELFTDMKNRLTSKYKSQDSKTNEQPNIVETY